VGELREATVGEALGLPFEAAGVRLSVEDPGRMLSVTPFRGRRAEVAERLGADLREGRCVPAGDGRVFWSGLDQWMAQGVAADLDGIAAVTEQGDGWGLLRVEGARAAEVLARLCPVDLSAAAFPEGSAARAPVGHVAAILIAVPGGLEVMVMRSFTATAAHEIAVAMRRLAGRDALRRGAHA
jgi:heterotetrameric sarcosine oxidase gamma subunit